MRKLAVIASVLFSFNSYTQDLVKIRECLIEAGVLKQIEIDYSQATGERTMMVNGVRKKFWDVHPKTGKEYADGQKWFINSDTVLFKLRPYIKYGLPRILSPTEVEKAGLYKGLGVYLEKGITGVAEVIYIPVRQGCEFQPYQIACEKPTIEQAKVTAEAMEFSAKTTTAVGKRSYVWTSDLPIIKGQGTNTITINTKQRLSGDVFQLTLEGTAGKVCLLNTAEFAVEKEQKQTSKWGAEERKAFMETCIRDSKMENAKATAYCSCMFEKIVKLYPDPMTIQKELKPELIIPMAKECLGVKN